MEHILLTDHSETECVSDEPSAKSRRTERTFRQFSRSKGYHATYEIFNSHYLEVRVRRAHGKPRRYTMDLAFLSAQPLRRVTIAWRTLAAALVAAVITAGLVGYIHYVDEPLLVNTWLPVPILAGTLAMVGGLFGVYRCSDRLLFHSAHGDTLFFELLNNGQRNHEFQSFVQDVIQRIQNAQAQRRTRNGQSRLVAELREHRRLKEAGVIGEDEYQHARGRILQCHE